MSNENSNKLFGMEDKRMPCPKYEFSVKGAIVAILEIILLM